jgi:hypothetical protein
MIYRVITKVKKVDRTATGSHFYQMVSVLRKTRKAARAVVAPRIAASVLGDRVANAKAFRKLVFNTEFGICYNRVRKNANSTTAVLMDKISGGALDAKQAKKLLPKVGTLDFKTLRKLPDFRYFVVVRSPYSRTLSAFLQRFQSDSTTERFGDFSLDPQGFRQFVRWLDSGGMNKDSHWDLQQRQMCFELNSYDAVVRMENYNAEIRAFLLETGVPEGRIDIGGSSAKGTFHQTKSSERIREFYDAEAIETVRRCYKSDFQALGYDPDHLI